MELGKIRRGTKVVVNRGIFCGAVGHVLGKSSSRRVIVGFGSGSRKSRVHISPGMLDRSPTLREHILHVKEIATKKASVKEARRRGYEDYVGGFYLSGNRYTKGTPQWKAWRAGYLEAKQEGADFSR